MSTGGSVEEDNLTEVEAKERGQCISKASYQLKLSFTRGASEYTGHLVAKFDYKAANNKTIFFDCISKSIDGLTVNGKDVSVSNEVVKDRRIYLPEGPIQGSNEVIIKFTNTYDKTGNGLHHFVDPEDKEEYLYTNFEPFYAHRFLPCFDQPDIKATLALTVEAPKEWLAVANDKEESTSEKDGKTVHVFKTTPPLSSYLFALVVGPYEKFEDKYNNVPMAFYVRKSLKPFLQPDLEELTTITKQGLKFYETFFDCPYPFTKYDQIFCPEYNIGAMENPGCITFTERYVYRDPPTDEQRLRRADTVLHEMAHMWFGDLVSPVWWDGLWLNESFASYMAALATAEATRFGSKSWLEFHSSYKRWAYREDQLSTTHAIQGEVVDTNSTFQNFDGITYGKGASVLKQLVAVVSMDGFKAGMQRYFKKHAWGNTTIGDFLHVIEEAAKVDLKQWSKSWLEIAGLNTLSPVWTTEGGKIKSFKVKQTAEAPHTELRRHKIEIAVFDADSNGAPVLRNTVTVDVEGSEVEIPALVGAEKPVCVWINNNDHAYAKVTLDDVSIAYLKDHVDQFKDTLTRQLLWSAFANMTRDAHLASQEMLELVQKKVATETDPKMVQFIITVAQGALANFIPEDLLLEPSHKFFNLCLTQLRAAKSKDDRIIWARALIGAAKGTENVKIIVDMLDKGTGVSDFELDQDMRWSVVQRAAAYGLDGAAALVEREQTRDVTDRGKRAMETVKVCPPDAAIKEEAWKRFMTDKESSMKIVNAAMGGFHWRHQRDLLAPYVDRFFNDIQSVFKEREFTFAENFYHILYPSYRVDDDILNRCETLLKKLDPSKDTILVRCLKESMDDIKRSQMCYALARKYASK
eukprot:TRINITY_DN7012_c0_g1_i1.p1 TRINITY_DN7012_c0_g1~~TRINITY_DN7012_c0_g1_i1.p1  ORF type:complete len:925 (+),score=266.42 TRINITY_DN7012_c0_g1_i1:192-2777(+)